MKFSLNIITKEISENNFYGELAQMGIVVEGAPTLESAIESIINELQSKVLDIRKARLDVLADNNTHELHVASIQCELVMDKIQIVCTDTPEEIAKKLSFLNNCHEMGVEEFAETLDRECDKNYVLSLKDKSLLEESMKLARNLKRYAKIDQPPSTEEATNQ